MIDPNKKRDMNNKRRKIRSRRKEEEDVGSVGVSGE